jgi:iron complex transport system ATP-binding protein
MIDCTGIKASYGEKNILHGVTFTVAKGEFIGIIGSNGAGKTTLLKILTGVKKPAAGKVVLDTKDIAKLSRKEIAHIMAVVPQSSFVPPLFTVEDVVTIGRYAHRSGRFSESDADRAAVDEAMRKTGTGRFRDRYVSELSGGERQEALIARALAQEPALLMLDEPTANLDLLHRMKILHLIGQLVADHALTAVMIIHDLNLAARFCDRLLLLHDGCILAEGPPRNVLTSANLAEAYKVHAVVEYNATVCAPQVTVLGCIDNNHQPTIEGAS